MDSILAIYRDTFRTMRGIKAMAANATNRGIFHTRVGYGPIKEDWAVGSA